MIDDLDEKLREEVTKEALRLYKGDELKAKEMVIDFYDAFLETLYGDRNSDGE
jgi:hypothetical protein